MNFEEDVPNAMTDLWLAAGFAFENGCCGEEFCRWIETDSQNGIEHCGAVRHYAAFLRRNLRLKKPDAGYVDIVQHLDWMMAAVQHSGGEL